MRAWEKIFHLLRFYPSSSFLFLFLRLSARRIDCGKEWEKPLSAGGVGGGRDDGHQSVFVQLKYIIGEEEHGNILSSVGSDPTDLLCSVLKAIKTNSFIPAFTISFQMDLGSFFFLCFRPLEKKNVCPSFFFSGSLAGLPTSYPEWSG